MSKRDELLTQLATNMSSLTNYSLSQELPFNSGETPLFQKNKKVLYVGQQNIVQTEFLPTLGADVFQTETEIEAYITVDAKNQPTDIDTLVSQVLSARTGVSGTFQSSSEVETEIEQDYITYTFTFNFVNI